MLAKFQFVKIPFKVWINFPAYGLAPLRIFYWGKGRKMSGVVSKVIKRGFSICRPLQGSLKEPLTSGATSTSSASHGANPELWKKIFIFVCVPTLALATINVLTTEHHHPKSEDFVPYEYLGIITIRFPWRDGKKPLFYNPHCNFLKDE